MLWQSDGPTTKRLGADMNVIFDIGNVLIKWEPKNAFRHAFASDAQIDAFFAEIGFFDWNLAQDCGRSRDEGVAVIAEKWPHYRDLIDGYFDRFGDVVSERIEESWTILKELQSGGVRLFALTNWAKDTWPIGLAKHPDLQILFEDIVVSGLENVLKPERRIFDLLCSRNQIDQHDCLFIDDSATNVKGAIASGMQAHHFTSAAVLRADLIKRGLLSATITSPIR